MQVDDKSYNPRIILKEPTFKLIFENAAVGIAQLDHKGQLLMVNNKICEITGYSREELLNKTFQEITHPDDLEADLQQAEALFHGHINSFSMEKRYIRKDGTVVWGKLTASAVFDETGKFHTFIGVIEDISEKKNAETALYVAEKHYKIASSAAKIGAYYRNLKAEENYWSPEFLKIFGLNPEDSLPLIDGIPAAVHPEDRKNVLRLAQKHYTYSSSNEFNDDHRIILPDGTIRWINVRGISEFDVHKKPLKTYGIVMDITKRKEAEEALKKSEEKFRVLANNMSQLALMMDDTGCVFWCNQRWLDYTGITLEEMQDWDWQKVHHPNHINRFTESIKHSVDSGEILEGLFPLKGKGGEYRWFQANIIPVTDENCKIIRWLGTYTDVTHQRNIEKQLKSDSKLIEDLLYVAAHDLRGPVANMYGALDLMDNMPLEKKVMFLERFRELADQLNSTVQGITDILSMRSSDNSSVSVIDVERLLDKVLLEFKDQLNGVTVQRNFEKPNVFYIRLYLQSIIKNLISNALIYCREDVPLNIEVSTYLKDDYTLLTIRDNGIGIDLKSYGNKLFSPFHRLNPKKTKGTGIGLYLIKGIIEKNGGYIVVESSPGKGTVFNCYLKEY